jgi:hypothetical protein
MITGPPNSTTHHTTRVPYCEICNKYGNYYDNLNTNCYSLIKDGNSWHILCDKHKKEYDVKYNMKLRKEKLEKINNYYGLGC